MMLGLGSGMDTTRLIADACEEADRLIARRAPHHEIFGCLIAAAERVSGSGAVSSVLLLDELGLLRNGASPNLPADYVEAIDGLRPDAAVGTCAAAAATGALVVTPSFLADDKWAELRHLPLAIGFAGAWSIPITSGRDGRVLGTFGTYYRDVRRPSIDEVAAIRALAAAVARALEQERSS
jgi:GAF domain-containing protein